MVSIPTLTPYIPEIDNLLRNISIIYWIINKIIKLNTMCVCVYIHIKFISTPLK